MNYVVTLEKERCLDSNCAIGYISWSFFVFLLTVSYHRSSVHHTLVETANWLHPGYSFHTDQGSKSIHRLPDKNNYRR